MWKASYFTERGVENERNGLPCQDCVCERQEAGVQAIALSDGAGKDDLARIGAMRACQTVSELLTSCFGALYAMEDAYVAFQVAVNVRAELSCLCREYGVSPERLQSTILAVAIDHATGRFLSVHLGDGEARCLREGHELVLSFPEYGVNRSCTYLTGSADVRQHIRVCRGETKGIDRFLLRSDGWSGGLRDDCFLDDVSFIALTRESRYNNGEMFHGSEARDAAAS